MFYFCGQSPYPRTNAPLTEPAAALSIMQIGEYAESTAVRPQAVRQLGSFLHCHGHLSRVRQLTAPSCDTIPVDHACSTLAKDEHLVMALDLALYQPDIAANTGTLLRLGACLGVPVHVIHPAGFAITQKNLARSGMDYLDHANLVEHNSFSAFEDWRISQGRRLVLMTTKSSSSLYKAQFVAGDILLLGRESAGVPDEVAERADLRIRIPMREGLRSLNIAIAGAMALGEAIRQTGSYAEDI